ncbi:MAG: arylamine N-acetyltransferase [Paenibacillus dendritiformis]|uniref:arylamine N-acetyltransferase family protein n=1 Tax=uncultured Paenibacillus sp. TaxID=227322 RepID=UPI0025F8D799|nr:arylamine N-acetyltransferase [uncultured Paenibacillus sp.]MDU5143637.1 arylamine N-acetyltransferase [Paenibacillus dendritiformis]
MRLKGREHLKSDVYAYLKRIGYDGPLDGSAAVLADLQECHLYAVPYENFDILNRVPLSLDIPDLIDKIITRRRGGYCFELNALFGWLLRDLGYSVTDLMARFWRDEPNPPPKRRHQVLQVKAGGETYLCDVGVGGIVPRRPVRIETGLEQWQEDECYRLERDPDYGWMLFEFKRDGWNRLYSFTEEPQLARDFIMPSYWCEHAPESIFTQQAMAAVRTREGRHTLAGDEFRIFTADGVHTFVPETKEQYDEALKTYFGIVLG